MNLENIGYTPNNDNYLTIQQVDNLRTVSHEYCI